MAAKTKARLAAKKPAINKAAAALLGLMVRSRRVRLYEDEKGGKSVGKAALESGSGKLVQLVNRATVEALIAKGFLSEPAADRTIVITTLGLQARKAAAAARAKAAA